MPEVGAGSMARDSGLRIQDSRPFLVGFFHTPPVGGPVFFGEATCMYIPLRKKLTGARTGLCFGMAYDAKKKRDYYQKNRDSRLKYQRDYYHKVQKYAIERKNEIAEVLEPEALDGRKNKLSAYNKAYYAKNKAKILAKRAASRQPQL